MKTTYIYALTEPDNLTVRYIGKADCPIERFKVHIRKAMKENYHKANWIKGLLRIGEMPKLIVLDEVDINEWQFWEIFYYNLYKSWGFKLTNTALCGIGGNYKNCHSKETIEKLRQISIERMPRGEDHPNYGKHISQEQKDKMQAGRLLKPRSTKPVYVYTKDTKELIKVFTSAKECCNELDIKLKRLQELLAGYRIVHKGVRENVNSLRGMIFRRTQL